MSAPSCRSTSRRASRSPNAWARAGVTTACARPSTRSCVPPLGTSTRSRATPSSTSTPAIPTASSRPTARSSSVRAPTGRPAALRYCSTSSGDFLGVAACAPRLGDDATIVCPTGWRSSGPRSAHAGVETALINNSTCMVRMGSARHALSRCPEMLHAIESLRAPHFEMLEMVGALSRSASRDAPGQRIPPRAASRDARDGRCAISVGISRCSNSSKLASAPHLEMLEMVDSPVCAASRDAGKAPAPVPRASRDAREALRRGCRSGWRCRRSSQACQPASSRGVWSSRPQRRGEQGTRRRRSAPRGRGSAPPHEPRCTDERAP